MSQAFVKEDDDNGLLHHVPPTVHALLHYLKKQHSTTFFVQKVVQGKDGVDQYYLSNGLEYQLRDNMWELVL